jgi:hypothetical protein
MTINSKTEVVLTAHEVRLALTRYAVQEGRLLANAPVENIDVMLPGGAHDVRDTDGARLVFGDSV